MQQGHKGPGMGMTSGPGYGPAPGMGARSAGTVLLPPRSLQHTWHELTRGQPWQSLGLVPLEDTVMTLPLAHEIARMAALDPRSKVLLLNATGRVGQESHHGVDISLWLGQGAGTAPPIGQTAGQYAFLDCARLGMDESMVSMQEIPRYVEAIHQRVSPFSKLLIATNSLIHQPSLVTGVRCLDAIAICATLGVSAFADAGKTLDMIHPEKIIGVIGVRPKQRRRSA